MTHEKITLTQLVTNKTKLNDFIRTLANEDKKGFIVDNLEIFKNIQVLFSEILWFSEFINTQHYHNIKTLLPQFFWFSGPVNGEQSYITIEKTLIHESFEYPSFTIGDIPTGKNLFEIAVIAGRKSLTLGFTIYDKDGNINYEIEGAGNTLLFIFEISNEGKRRVWVKHLYQTDHSLTA